MVNFEGVSNSYDLFGTNGTSPEIQVKADLTLKDASGGTVLHAAALMGHMAIVNLLLENGAPLEDVLANIYHVNEKTQICRNETKLFCCDLRHEMVALGLSRRRRWRFSAVLCLCLAVLELQALVLFVEPFRNPRRYRDSLVAAHAAMVDNPYDILGLPHGCSEDEIKPAFRRGNPVMWVEGGM
eukprot:symbB.v1.2.027399.t1/scaffold2808.1/size69842/1